MRRNLAILILGGCVILFIRCASSPKLRKEIKDEYAYLYESDSAEIKHLIELRQDERDTTRK